MQYFLFLSVITLDQAERYENLYSFQEIDFVDGEQ